MVIFASPEFRAMVAQILEICQIARTFTEALAACDPEGHLCPMVAKSPLDDPEAARFAWRRYCRLLRWMAAATLAVVILAVAWLWAQHGLVSIHLYVAAVLGVGFTVMLAAALMGLVFLSSGTGHDESIVDPMDDIWKS